MDKTQFLQKFLQSEITKTVAIVMATIAVSHYFMNPTEDLAARVDAIGSEISLSKQIQNIKDNDLHTIEGKVQLLDDKLSEIKQAQVRLETIINERLPAQK